MPSIPGNRGVSSPKLALGNKGLCMMLCNLMGYATWPPNFLVHPRETRAVLGFASPGHTKHPYLVCTALMQPVKVKQGEMRSI